MQPFSPLRPLLPRRSGDRVRWEGLRGSSRSLAVAAAAREFPGLTLVVAPDAAAADTLRTEIAFFGGTGTPAESVVGTVAGERGPAGARPAGPDLPLLLPDWETLPYDALSPHQDIVSERLATLHALPGVSTGLLVATVTTLMGRVAPRGFVEGNAMALSVGDRLDLEAMRRRLDIGGYRCVSQVMEHGEFAVRGSLLDLFPTGAEHPYRIDLFDAEVETIRTFDPESQRSLDRTGAIRLLPAREFPLDPEAIGRFRAAWRSRFEGNPNACPVYRDVSEGFAPAGIEYWLPLFFDHTGTLFDYLPESTLVIELAGARDEAGAFWEDTAARHEQRRHDPERPVLAPKELFLSPDELGRALAAYPRALVREEPDEPRSHPGPNPGASADGEAGRDPFAEAPAAPPRPPLREVPSGPGTAGRERARGRAGFGTANAPPLPADPRASEPFALFKQFLERFSGRVLLLVESLGRMETLVETLRRHDLRPHRFAGWPAFLRDPEERRFGIALSEVERGAIIDDPAIALLPESLLFGRRAAASRRRARARDAESVIRSLTELQPGDPVVHERHGVGRYRGLVVLTAAGVTGEYLNIEYADRDQLYVPVLSLHLVSRYAGGREPAPAQARQPAVAEGAQGGLRPGARRRGGAPRDPGPARRAGRQRDRVRRRSVRRVLRRIPLRGDPPTRRPRSRPPSTTSGAIARWTASCAETWGSARRRWPCARRSRQPWKGGRSRSSYPPPSSRSSISRRSATASPNGRCASSSSRVSVRAATARRSPASSARDGPTSSSEPTACSRTTSPSAASAS